MPDLAAWLNQIGAASPLAFLVVAFAGLTMGLAPSSLPLAAVVTGCVAGRTAAPDRDDRWAKGLLLSGGFVLGMATVDAVLGAAFGLVGHVAIRVLASRLALINLVLAALLTILGLALLRTIRIVTPVPRPAPRRVDTFAGAYALGIPFGLSVCPACTPMVLPILGAAAATGTPWLGAVLLFVFGLARGVPLLLVGAAAGMATHARRLALWVPRLERLGGILLLVAALFFLYQSAAYAGLAPPLRFLVG